MHIGRPDIYGEGELEAIFDQLNEIAPGLTVNTGDVAQSGDAAAYVTYLAQVARLNHPMYTVPGNHDAYYVHYDAAGLTRHFYVEQDDIAIIGLDTQEAGGSCGSISADELAYLEARLIEAGDKNKIVIAHHPLYLSVYCITIGRDELLALLNAYGVTLYLSGHIHGRTISTVVEGITFINGGVTSYGIGGPHMMYFERCEENHLHMRNISARAPFGTMADAQPVEIPLN